MRVAANNLKILLKSAELLVPNDQANWSHGVTVSTQDSEFCDPSSNLGGTLLDVLILFSLSCHRFELLEWSLSSVLRHKMFFCVINLSWRFSMI